MKKQLTEDLETAKKSLTYTNDALNTDLENWERKEFELVKKELINEIKSLENRLITFNQHILKMLE